MHIPVVRHIKPAVRKLTPTFLSIALVTGISVRGGSQGLTSIASPMTERERMHQSDQWHEIQKHLPDPATASPQSLEQQADILRARRFPEDAMDYYKYAMDRGGNPPALLNKLGLAELEMHHIQLARVYFQRVVKMDKKNAEAWNNLGASEFIDGRNQAAISDYKKAIKISRRSAVFHANLANAYFEARDDHGARREIATALELDPHVFEQEGTGGVAAHVLSSADAARFSFEMAKMYARTSMEEEMLRSLAKAAEAGMDIRHEMEHDPVLAKYAMDPRVLTVVRNAEMVRATRTPAVGATDIVKPLSE
ncbi:MAG TPA: tetratricopeptide repeat protein [Acidobacteriaceae bacterium]|nr:tetratricopeptide repeat protein [Acidobacteriaceae bacterium]